MKINYKSLNQLKEMASDVTNQLLKKMNEKTKVMVECNHDKKNRKTTILQ